MNSLDFEKKGFLKIRGQSPYLTVAIDNQLNMISLIPIPSKEANMSLFISGNNLLNRNTELCSSSLIGSTDDQGQILTQIDRLQALFKSVYKPFNALIAISLAKKLKIDISSSGLDNAKVFISVKLTKKEFQ